MLILLVRAVRARLLVHLPGFLLLVGPLLGRLLLVLCLRGVRLFPRRLFRRILLRMSGIVFPCLLRRPLRPLTLPRLTLPHLTLPRLVFPCRLSLLMRR